MKKPRQQGNRRGRKKAGPESKVRNQVQTTPELGQETGSELSFLVAKAKMTHTVYRQKQTRVTEEASPCPGA